MNSLVSKDGPMLGEAFPIVFILFVTKVSSILDTCTLKAKKGMSEMLPFTVHCIFFFFFSPFLILVLTA